MKKVRNLSKLLIGIPILVLTATLALPAQAAINVGAPKTQSGSVISIRSVTTATQTTPAQNVGSSISSNTQTQSPTQTQTPKPSATFTQSTQTGNSIKSGSIVSLKSILSQSKSVNVTNPTTNRTQSTPASSAPTSSTAPVIPPTTSLTADEQLMINLINQQRASAGVAPVQVDFRLVAVARAKANDMKANNYFDHTSPTYGSPWAMMQQAGINFRWAGENIAGNKSVDGAMAAFMQSPGHRANILDPRFTHIGVGIAYGTAYGNIYVQEFAQEN